MDGRIVFREVVIVHTVWISIARRYLPVEKHQMITMNLVCAKSEFFFNFEFTVNKY